MKNFIYWLSICLVSLTASAAEPSFSSFRGKRRKLILLGDSPNEQTFARAVQNLDVAKREVLARDLVVIKEAGVQSLHQRYSIHHGFVAILIGKDGTEKWRRDVAFDPRELFDEIDKMPIRREEIRAGQASP